MIYYYPSIYHPYIYYILFPYYIYQTPLGTRAYSFVMMIPLQSNLLVLWMHSDIPSSDTE